MELYFARHDGQAVTCEDFVQAMADASGRDLGQFMRWYGQAGTPELKVERSYDPARQALTLEISQSTPATPGQPEKLPFHIPIRMGLVGADGTAQPLQLEGENEPKGTDRVLELTERTQRFTFLGLEAEPVPSLLRDFSAPVKLHAGYDDDQLAQLMAHDSDAFTRWDAGQRLAGNVLLTLVKDHAAGRPSGALDQRLVDAFAASLDRAGIRRSPPGRCRCRAAAISASRWRASTSRASTTRSTTPASRWAAPCGTAGSPPITRISTRDRSRWPPRP
jgi:aminopeptidase N